MKNDSTCTLSIEIELDGDDNFFLTWFKFLYAIAYWPTIQGFLGLSRNLSRRPGIRSIRSGILTFLASYYGVYQVFYIISVYPLVEILWSLLKNNNNNKDSAGKLPTPLEK